VCSAYQHIKISSIWCYRCCFVK